MPAGARGARRGPGRLGGVGLGGLVVGPGRPAGRCSLSVLTTKTSYYYYRPRLPPQTPIPPGEISSPTRWQRQAEDCGRTPQQPPASPGRARSSGSLSGGVRAGERPGPFPPLSHPPTLPRPARGRAGLRGAPAATRARARARARLIRPAACVSMARFFPPERARDPPGRPPNQGLFFASRNPSQTRIGLHLQRM